MNSLKIGLIITNLRGGGAEKAILKLAKLLGERGVEVHLVLLEDIIEYPTVGPFKLHILRAARKGYIGKYLTAWRLRKLFKRLGSFECIISTLPFADEVANLAKLPRLWHRIANTLSLELAMLSPKKSKRRQKRYHRLYAKSHLIAVSQGVFDDLHEMYPQANIKMIVNPFDPDSIRAKAQEDHPLIPNEPYIIHVGRFSLQKRHDLLFEAFKLANCREKLLLLTQPCNELTALIEQYQLKDKIIVAGFQGNPYPWIKRASLLVLSSDREGLPNVLIEALICDTKIVSTDCKSGPREILQGNFLVPCNHPHALAKAIKETLIAPKTDTSSYIAPYLETGVGAKYEALCAEF